MSDTDNQNISNAYKKIATEQPPSELDSIILSAAHAEAPKKSNVIPLHLIPDSWIMPLTVAATIVLSVGLVLTIPDSDFQKTSEQDYVIPESIEEQKLNNVAEVEYDSRDASSAEFRKELKSKTKQEKTAATRSLGLSDMKQAPAEKTSKDALLRKSASTPKPAMSSQPTKSSSIKLDRDTSAQLESASAESPAVPRSTAMAPQKRAAKMAKPKTRKKIAKILGREEFLKNIKKVSVGDNKTKVYELLGTPLVQKSDTWQYQYRVAGIKKNYFIRFKNNLVAKIDK